MYPPLMWWRSGALYRYRASALAVVLAVVALGVTTLGGTAQASTVATSSLTTTSSCTYGISNGNTLDCITVDHSGSYIQSASASAITLNVCRTLKEFLSGPNGTIKESGWVKECPGDPSVLETWRPYSTEPVGYYCATTDRLNSDGTVTQIARACVHIG